MGCIKRILSNPVAKIATDVGLALVPGGAPFIPLANAAETKLGGGSWGDALKSGAESFAGQELLPVAGNAFSSAFPETAASLGITGGSNTLTDLLGQTTGGGSLTGAGTLGGDILGITNAAGLTNSAGGVSTGLSRALSGGASTSDALTGPGSSASAALNTEASPSLAGGTGGGASSFSPATGSATSPISGLSSASDNTDLPWLKTAPSITPTGGATITPSVGNSASTNYDLNGTVSALANPAATAATTGGSKMATNMNLLGSLLGGADSLYANNQAQTALTKAQKNAMGVMQPYLASGTAANSKLSDLLGTSGNSGTAGYGTLGTPFTPGDLTQTPGYQFQLDQGDKALQRQEAASGNLGSGAAMKAAQQYGQGLASTTYQQQLQDYLQQQQQQYGMLSGQAGAGENAANNIGGLYGNIGTAKANADIGASGVLNQTLSSLLSGNGARRPVNIGGQVVYV